MMVAATTTVGRHGYRAAALGSVVGTVLGLVLAGFMLAIVVGILGLSAAGQITSSIVLTVAALGLLGAPVGCGAALHLERQPASLPTAVVMLGLLTLSLVGLRPLLGGLELETVWSLRLLFILGLPVIACLARALVLVSLPKPHAAPSEDRSDRERALRGRQLH